MALFHMPLGKWGLAIGLATSIGWAEASPAPPSDSYIARAAGKHLGEGGLRRALDQLNVARGSEYFFDATDTVLKFIPLGMPERRVVDILSRAGLRPVGRVSHSIYDPRCRRNPLGPTSAPYPCPDPTNKSDYYVSFEHIVGWSWVVITTDYVDVGFRAGVVEFVFASINVDALVP
jgi:hypothetical protein